MHGGIFRVRASEQKERLILFQKIYKRGIYDFSAKMAPIKYVDMLSENPFYKDIDGETIQSREFVPYEGGCIIVEKRKKSHGPNSKPVYEVQGIFGTNQANKDRDGNPVYLGEKINARDAQAKSRFEKILSDAGIPGPFKFRGSK